MAQGRDALIALLKQRHDFTAWSGASQPAAAIRDAHLGPADLPGWTLVRSKRRADVQPLLSESFWRPADSQATESAALVRIEVYELPSVEAARAHLLDVLADIESAEFERRPDLAVGDVAFGFDTALLFARANVVVFVRNAERRTVVVTPIARTIDTALVRRSADASS